MNALAALAFEKIIEYLLTQENVDKVVKEILGLINGVPDVAVTDALQELRACPQDQLAEQLEYTGKILETHDCVKPETFAAILVNNTNVSI